MKRDRSRCYCTNLRRAANTVSLLYSDYLSSAGVTVNQFSLLVNLERRENCSVSEFSAHVGLERTTLVRTLKPLIDRGLVRDISAAGQRNRILQLTKEGKEVVRQGKPLWERAQKEIERRIGSENVDFLYEILEKLENG